MAQLPKCCGCEYYIFGKFSCKRYNGKIPKEILFEKNLCEYYLLKRDTDTIDDLPIAKGR